MPASTVLPDSQRPVESVRPAAAGSSLLAPSTGLPDEGDVDLTASFFGLVTHGDRPLTARGNRDVLAGVLGLPPNALRGVSEAASAEALERLQSLVRRLREAAGTDELTGAMRRGAGLQALSRDLARVRRASGRLVLAVVDVDGLKRVNDTHGHLAGDRLLREVVTSLREELREYDLVIRYGGDEFLCVFSDADIRDVRTRYRHLATALAQRTGGQSVSVGLAALRPSDDVDRLVGRADASLYAGRRRRRVALERRQSLPRQRTAKPAPRARSAPGS